MEDLQAYNMFQMSVTLKEPIHTTIIWGGLITQLETINVKIQEICCYIVGNQIIISATIHISARKYLTRGKSVVKSFLFLEFVN